MKKSYTKSLKEFIEYIFNKYKKDKNVNTFQEIYLSREQQKAQKRELKQLTNIITKSVKITNKTARLCSKLIKSELVKNELLKHLSEDFIDELEFAKSDLSEALGYDN